MIDDVQEIPYPFETEIVDAETKDILSSAGMGCVEIDGKRLPFKHIKIRLEHKGKGFNISNIGLDRF